MSYRQLALEERYHIEVYLKEQLSQADMARRLGRHPSTISRELKRNGARERTPRYAAGHAGGLARRRRIMKGERCRKISGVLKQLVEERLRWGWSPEQICGRLQVELGTKLSHETVYQHVLRDSRRAGVLRYCLRFGGYKHHRFKRSHMAEQTRRRKRWVGLRPAAANDRTEIGHWERDCIEGRKGGAVLLTLIDRRSRYTRIRRVSGRCHWPITAATRKALAPHRGVNKSITNDNGREFSQQTAMHLEQALGVRVFFTEPGAPWQRGSIENLNGLVRQYVPKATDIAQLPESVDIALEETLNNRPRKNLGFRTPYEVFYEEKTELMNKETVHFGMKFSMRT